MLSRYMVGALTARTGDEMSGPALLVVGLTATSSPVVASWLLAGLTVSAALGGPLLGVLLDRASRPGRLLGWCLLGYAAGLVIVSLGLGRVPVGVLIGVAAVTGLLGPSLNAGWTAQLPLVAPGSRLHRANALDSMTYNVAGLAGPAVVGVLTTLGGGFTAVVASVVLLLVAAPAAWRLPHNHPAESPPPDRPPPPAQRSIQVSPPSQPSIQTSPPDQPPIQTSLPDQPPAQTSPRNQPPVQASLPGRLGVWGELVAGFAAIARNRRLARATLASMVSISGTAMLVVSAPLLGSELAGSAGHGALLLAVTAATALAANAVLARRTRPAGRKAPPAASSRPRPALPTDLPPASVRPSAPAGAARSGWSAESVLAGSTLVVAVGLGVGVVAALAGSFWVAVLAAAVTGVGEGPQLTALFSVRHREAPAGLRSQIFTTGASLKITSYALGSALAGPLAAHSVAAALLAGAALQVVAVLVLAVLSRA
ncbi:MFS transporter [Nonomuraea sp. NPDC000554]|uniref:MFS transporter n=1 Tax=Nonomuraea sp. NPDC000554 TaxID=3154259 RepID=UPI0033248EF6